MNRTLNSDKQLANGLLLAAKIPRDQLPYTPKFDEMYRDFCTERLWSEETMSQFEFWRLLCSVAKQGGCSVKTKAASPGETVAPEALGRLG